MKLPGYLYQPSYRVASGEKRKAGIWWWKHGKVRASTRCRDRKAAEAWVVQQLAKMGRGEQLVLRACFYEELEQMVLDRWAADGRRGVPQCSARLRFLRRAFAGWRADAITTDQIASYALRRRGEGAAVATVNLEVAILRRMFSVAYEAGRIARMPVVHRLAGAAVRQGFLEDGDFERICAGLPERLQPVARFLKLTGWREREALELEWRRVDLVAQEIRLDTSKNGLPRMLAFGDYAPLRELLDARSSSRQALSPYVFPGRGWGRPVDRTTFQKAWRQAAIAAGLPRALVHDLRRSFVRACERAGVPRCVAMSITGHKSEEVYRRYAIVSAGDQQAGLARIGALAPETKIAQFPGAAVKSA
jgi:integrase